MDTIPLTQKRYSVFLKLSPALQIQRKYFLPGTRKDSSPAVPNIGIIVDTIGITFFQEKAFILTLKNVFKTFCPKQSSPVI